MMYYNVSNRCILTCVQDNFFPFYILPLNITVVFCSFVFKVLFSVEGWIGAMAIFHLP